MFKIQNSSELWIIPLALVISFILQSAFSFLSIFSWLASLPIHECGHALIGNLSGQLSIPTPMYTVALGPERNWVLIFIIAASLCLITLVALRKGQAVLASLSAFTLTLQISLTFILPKNITAAARIYAGQASELIGSVFILLLFHASMPERFNWKVNRYLFLVIAALTFTKAARLWVEASGNPAILPLGAAIDFGLMRGENSDGDLDRLIRDFGWSQQQIISVYQKTLYLSILTLLSGLGLLFLKNAAAQTIALRDQTSISDN